MTKEQYEALIVQVETDLADRVYESETGYYDALAVVHIANGKLVSGWPEEADPENTYLTGAAIEHHNYHGPGGATVLSLVDWAVRERTYWEEQGYENVEDEDEGEVRASEHIYDEPLASAMSELFALVPKGTA